jgi:hypothetical protein
VRVRHVLRRERGGAAGDLRLLGPVRGGLRHCAASGHARVPVAVEMGLCAQRAAHPAGHDGAGGGPPDVVQGRRRQEGAREPAKCECPPPPQPPPPRAPLTACLTLAL